MKKTLVVVVVLFLLAGCVTPTPQVIEKYPTAEAYTSSSIASLKPSAILINESGGLAYAKVYVYASLLVDCVYFYDVRSSPTNELSCNWK